MIDNLTITFESNGIAHTLNVPTRDENLPYNLATAFTEIIKQSDANDEIVIDNLKDEFAYGTNSWISVNDRLPEVDREVIALDDEGRISFAHIVDTITTKHYGGWNIPSVEYWMPFNNPLED
jgi:hypothetical protein